MKDIELTGNLHGLCADFIHEIDVNGKKGKLSPDSLDAEGKFHGLAIADSSVYPPALSDYPYAGEFIDKKSSVAQDGIALVVNKDVLFLYIDNSWVPSLKLLLKKIIIPKVVVDKGAIKFVVNGADIMRPGITACDDFETDSFVAIVDETLGKPIAVGKSFLSSVDLMAKTGGKHIKNLHFIGDDFWLL